MTASEPPPSDWQARYDAALAEADANPPPSPWIDSFRVAYGLAAATVVLTIAGVALVRTHDLLARIVGVMLLSSLALTLGGGLVALVRRVVRRRR